MRDKKLVDSDADLNSAFGGFRRGLFPPLVDFAADLVDRWWIPPRINLTVGKFRRDLSPPLADYINSSNLAYQTPKYTRYIK